MTTTGDIRTELIKDFNNGVPVVVLFVLSCIIPDNYVIDFSAQILADVIKNLFRDLSPLLMALPSSPLFPSLPALTTNNCGNIPTTFIYYMLICIQDLVLSRWPYFFLPSFSLCLLQLLAIPVIFLQLSFTIGLFVFSILSPINVSTFLSPPFSFACPNPWQFW